MGQIRWIWFEEGTQKVHDFKVDDRSTIYQHLHEELHVESISFEEHRMMLKAYLKHLHTAIVDLPSQMLDMNGRVILTFHSISEHEPTDMGQNLHTEHDIENDTKSIDEKDNVANIGTENDELEDWRIPIEWHDEDERANQDNQMNSQTMKFFSFSTPEENEDRVKYKFHYRQKFTCQKERKEWVSLIRGNEELRTEIYDQKPSISEDIYVCFLIDTSMSMMKWIEGVRSQCRILARGVEEISGRKPKLSLAGYGIGKHKRRELLGDEVSVLVSERYNVVMWPFGDEETFQNIIDNFRLRTAGANGCFFAETGTHWVLQNIFETMQQDNLNILIHISDEFDTTGKNQDLQSILSLVRLRKDVTMYTLGIPSPGHILPTEESGGKFWDISKDALDVLEILGEVGDEIKAMLQFDSNQITGDVILYEQYDASPFISGNQHDTRGTSIFSQINDANPSGVFDGIVNMECYYCKSIAYGKCGNCGTHSCLDDDLEKFTCPSCDKTIKVAKSGRVTGQAQNPLTSKKGK